jgi:hypothetical protein
MAAPETSYPKPTVESAAAAQRSLDILECELHASRSEWLFLREIRVGTGRRSSSARRLDAFTLNGFPHLGVKRYVTVVLRACCQCSKAQSPSVEGDPFLRRAHSEGIFLTKINAARTGSMVKYQGNLWLRSWGRCLRVRRRNGIIAIPSVSFKRIFGERAGIGVYVKRVLFKKTQPRRIPGELWPSR